jgi:hypothetical protein
MKKNAVRRHPVFIYLCSFINVDQRLFSAGLERHALEITFSKPGQWRSQVNNNFRFYCTTSLSMQRMRSLSMHVCGFRIYLVWFLIATFVLIYGMRGKFIVDAHNRN